MSSQSIGRIVSFAAGTLVLACFSATLALAQAPTFLGSWPTVGLPLGLATDAANDVYLVDEGTQAAIHKYSPWGTPLAAINPGAIFEAYGLAFLSDQSILVADYYGRTISRYNSATGSPMGSWVSGGSNAVYLAADELDNVYVTSDNSDEVFRYSSGGILLGSWSSPHPTGIAYFQGVVYVMGLFNGLVSKYQPDGTPLGSFPTGLSTVDQISFDAQGHLYLADRGLNMLKCMDRDGSTRWTVGPTVPGYSYGSPQFISVTVAQDGTIYAGDFAHRRVLVFGTAPTATRTSTFGAVKTGSR